jgi:hypothetical protein
MGSKYTEKIAVEEGLLKRSFKLLWHLIIISGLGLFPVTVSGDSGAAAQGDAPYFSDKDMEKYKMPSDNKSPDAKVNRTATKAVKTQERKEQQDREYWCRKATVLKRKIEKGQDDISETEKELSAQDLKRKKRIALEKTLARSKKQVAYTEKDLADFDDEAHRKGIPPGWLRCQFE